MLEKNTPTASLQRDKTPPTNDCSGYETKLSHKEKPVDISLGNVEYSFIAIALMSALERIDNTW